MATPALALGIDFGTSGVRAIVVDSQRQPQWHHRQSYSSTPDLATSWQQTLFEVLAQLPQSLKACLGAIAIDGTSATVLLCDAQGLTITPPLLYNDAQGGSMLPLVQAMAPANSPVVSATSSLAKLLWWHQTLPSDTLCQAKYLLHQTDWLSAQLHGQWGISDYHNSLKLGYDAAALEYPQWLRQGEWFRLLPQVVAPGEPIAPITSALAERFGLDSKCQVIAGTTDSNAAFLASGAQTVGDAVTSLGSTLVIKLLSPIQVEASQYGIYSHRFGNQWLVGGASNTGGAVLRQFFDDASLAQLSQSIDPTTPISLDYYPLCQAGERFPINDPGLEPRLTPRPEDDILFLHGLLLGMARIEKRGYDLLSTLGAGYPKQVYTAGGGAHNKTWTTLRENCLQVPIKKAAHPEAAMGTALLALAGYETFQQG
jgi:sugar (pentulose or hexulose) kinase